MIQKSKVNNRGQSLLTVPLVIIALAIWSFGSFPSQNFFWARCWSAEWAVLILIGVLFFKNLWLKSFFLWCVILNAVYRVLHMPNYNAASFVSFYYILLFLALYEVLSQKLQKRDIMKIINGLCVLVLIQLGFMFGQYFKIDPFFTPTGVDFDRIAHYTTGFWGHTNLSGAFLAMCLPLFFRRKWWLFSIPLLIMLFFTRSLGAILSLSGGLIFLLFFLKNKKLKIAFLALVLLATCFYGKQFDRDRFTLQNDRFRLARLTWDVAKVKPIVGWGLGQYKIAFHAINRDVFKTGIHRGHAHNEFMELFLEIGIGAFFLLGFLGHLFIGFLKNRTYLSLLLMTGLMSALINSCSTFTFHTPLAWFVLIYLVILRKETDENKILGSETTKGN